MFDKVTAAVNKTNNSQKHKPAARILQCINCEGDFWATKPEYYCEVCKRRSDKKPEPDNDILREEWDE